MGGKIEKLQGELDNFKTCKVIAGETVKGMDDFRLLPAHGQSTRGVVKDTDIVNDGTSYLLKNPGAQERKHSGVGHPPWGEVRFEYLLIGLPVSCLVPLKSFLYTLYLPPRPTPSNLLLLQTWAFTSQITTPL